MFKNISQRKFKSEKLAALVLLLALPVVLPLVLTACRGGDTDTGVTGVQNKIGSFFTTYYFVPNESQYGASATDAIKDINGKVIAKVNSDFKKELDVEGSGILRSGRTVNFAQRVNDEIRYRFSKPKWGWGVGQCELKPYKTVAVDPAVIPLGTTLFIPAIKGAVLPDGTIHDGIFTAEDIGSKILKFHVDLFASDGKESGEIFKKIGRQTGNHVDVYKIKDPDASGCQSKAPVAVQKQTADEIAHALSTRLQFVNQ